MEALTANAIDLHTTRAAVILDHLCEVIGERVDTGEQPEIEYVLLRTVQDDLASISSGVIIDHLCEVIGERIDAGEQPEIEYVLLRTVQDHINAILNQ